MEIMGELHSENDKDRRRDGCSLIWRSTINFFFKKKKKKKKTVLSLST
jgi:hypothetical protein